MEKIYFYIDDSGVFSENGDDYCVFAGYVFLSKGEKESASRKYRKVEKRIKQKYENMDEMKGYTLEPKDKAELYRVLNGFRRFGTVISTRNVYPGIMMSRYDRQRYLDYCVIRAIKTKLQRLISEGLISPYSDYEIVIQMDEHTTSSNALYDFKENLRRELCVGKFNYRHNLEIKPIFKGKSTVSFSLHDSKQNTLIRASDIVANRMFFECNRGNLYDLYAKVCLIVLP